jgi:hypothetical protein
MKTSKTLSAAATPPLSVPPAQHISLLARRAAKLDETQEDDSEGEDFLRANVFRRRSLHLNRRRPGNVNFDEEDTSDDDTANVIAEGTNERDEMLEEEDVNDDGEFPQGDTTSAAATPSLSTSTEQPCPYMEFVQAKIANNKAFLKSLGLGTPPKAEKAKRMPKKRVIHPVVELRRSKRLIIDGDDDAVTLDLAPQGQSHKKKKTE